LNLLWKDILLSEVYQLNGGNFANKKFKDYDIDIKVNDLENIMNVLLYIIEIIFIIIECNHKNSAKISHNWER
jgi:hypothetical protein